MAKLRLDDASNHSLLMHDTSENRPGEDTLARVLDWVGLAFGLGVILFVTEFSLVPV